METKIQFNCQIPQYYQDVLTPLLFDDFSRDLMSKFNFTNARHVLELASGTDSVTKYLVNQLPEDAHLIATDLEEDIPEIAKQFIQAPNLSWDKVNITNIPYTDEQFDLVICQFGLMLVPEKHTTLEEIHRV